MLHIQTIGNVHPVQQQKCNVAMLKCNFLIEISPSEDENPQPHNHACPGVIRLQRIWLKD